MQFRNPLSITLFFIINFAGLQSQVNFNPVCYETASYPLNNATDYLSNDLKTFTICPQGSELASITFTYFDIEVNSTSGGVTGGGCYDFVEIFDNGVSLGTYCSEADGDGGVPFSPASDLFVHNTFTASASGNCLTVVFDSDATVEESGLAFIVNCSNDYCAGALDYTSVFGIIDTVGTCPGNEKTLDISGYTDAGFDPTCENGNDAVAWYTWVATAENLHFTSGYGEPGIEVLTGTCGNLSSVACLYNFSDYITGLEVDSTYYFMIWDDGTAGDSVTWCLQTEDAPINDSCLYAIEISCGDTIIASTILATDNDAVAPCGSGTDATIGLWYTFIGTGDTAVLSTDNFNTSFNTELQIFSGSCSNLVCVAGADDGGPNFNGEVIEFVTTANQPYYVYVDGDALKTGQFELTYTCKLLCNSTNIVTNTSDAGLGSLRRAIHCSSSGDTIRFDAAINGDSIKLLSPISIPTSLTFLGNGPSQTIIDGSLSDGRLINTSTANTNIFRNMTFQHGGSTMSNGLGGAVDVKGNCKFIECTFAFNQLTGAGALYILNSRADIINCVFHHNKSIMGHGGAMIIQGAAAECNIINSLFYKNESAFTGGAMLTYQEANTRIFNSTIVNNLSVGRGGGVNSQGPCTLHNSIVSGNQASIRKDITINAIGSDWQHNIIGDTVTLANFPGLIVGYPSFVDTAAHNYQLADTSIGVDAGLVSLIPIDSCDVDFDGNVTEQIDVDLASNNRITNCIVDIGAYEIPRSLTVINTNDAGHGSLRALLACAAAGDTIIFAPSIDGDSIKLLSTIVIPVSLTLLGNGPSQTIIDGSLFTGRLMQTLSLSTTTFKGLNFQHGGSSTLAGFGGAISANGYCKFMDCTFAYNRCDRGGALDIFLSEADIINCVFHDNKSNAGYGGAIVAEGGSTKCRITNSLFYQNQAFDRGGAIRSGGTESTIITNTTIVDNDAGLSGGGIVAVGDITIYNSIISGNHAISEKDILFDLVTQDLQFNIIGDTTGINGSQGLIVGFPAFVDTAAKNYQLADTSIGIDAGLNALIPIDSCDVDADGNIGEQVDVDLTGAIRVAYCGVDMGAYERGSIPFCPAINDDCENAIVLPPITESCVLQKVNTYRATQSAQKPNCFGPFPTYDLWYEIVAPASGIIIFDLELLTITNSRKNLSIWKNCGQSPGSEIYCRTLDNRATITNLQPDSTYFISIYTADFFTREPRDSFNFCIRTITCPLPEFIDPPSEVTSHSAKLFWSSNIAAQQNNIQVCPSGAGLGSADCLIFTTSADSLIVTGLAACMQYDAFLYSSCTAGDSSDVDHIEFTTVSEFSNTPVCGDTLSYPGCTGFQYPSYANDTFMICPTGTDTASIRFTRFETESNSDFLFIYDNGNLVNSLSGLGLVDSTFTAAQPATCLTLVFQSDRNINHLGFDFIVQNCTVCPTVQHIQGMPDEGSYFAGSLIHSDAIIESPNGIIFQAGGEVMLNAGFEVELGAQFDAVIGDCP